MSQSAGTGSPAVFRHWFDRSTQSKATRRVIVTLVACVVALGGALRLHRFDELSLWLDEGFTVRFSRLPWIDVLGLKGEYDPTSAPLLYAGETCIDCGAGSSSWSFAERSGRDANDRVLYLLVARLMRPAAGLLAALMLALSPLHFWYSQEARQYAPMTLAVALAYLALIEFDHARMWRWAGLYGGACLAAVYIDYSAIFALIPSAGVAAWIDLPASS